MRLNDDFVVFVIFLGDFSDVVGFGDDVSERLECIGKLYMCDECYVIFIKYILLKLYFLKYMGEKKYRCEYCYKIFFSFSSLKIYVCVYIGDCLFKCKECLRKFSFIEF